jgi:RimK family alpha-L-glutamate ligase
MQILILSARTGWHTDELCRALIARGHQPRVAPYESLVARFGERSNDSNQSNDFDAVLARIIPNGSLEQIIFRVDALHWLEDRGIPVVNSARAIERSVDKFYTTALLHQAGLPVPETVVCERADDAMDAIRLMLSRGGEVIVKPIFGSMGHGLVRIADPELAWRVVRPLEQMKAVFYVQRAINHGGRDVRLFVVGGRVLGSIERTAPPGDWRTNVARGGTALAIDPPPEWREYAVAATQIVGADYAGVDLLVSRTGQIFLLEVNGIPGWKGLQSATGIDVADAIVHQLERRIVERHQIAGESVHA